MARHLKTDEVERPARERQLLGTDMPTWGTYEDGLVRMPPDEALKLAAQGIPLNWIYDGKMTNLPRTFVQKFGNCSASR